MPAVLFAGADAIQADVEAILPDERGAYKKLSLDDKLQHYQQIAVERCAANAGCNWSALIPHVTDFISFGASIYEPHHLMDGAKRAALLALTGIELHTVDLGGASVPAALELARKLCAHEERLVLIAGSEVPRGGPASIAYYREVSDTLLDPVTEKHSEANLIALYALLADRLMTETGIGADDAQAITEHYRTQAQQNARAATYGKNLKAGELTKTLAGIYATAMVAVATDHGIAFLVANDRLLAKLEQRGIVRAAQVKLYVNAVGTNSAHKYICRRPDFSSPAALAAKRAFAQTELSAHDIDYAWIYDCFTLMLVRQAADYFGIDAQAAANSLKNGMISVGGKDIPVNRQGGILNTQAAIALSAGTGLIDIMAYAAENPQAKNFLFGGNGGIDTTNAVALLSREPNERKQAVLPAMPQQLTDLQALTENEVLTLYAAVPVRFNPGSEVPFALGAFRRQDETLCLARIVDTDLKAITDVASLRRDKAQFTVRLIDGRPFAMTR